MLEAFAAGLEATALARALRASIWAYPLINAGHVLGIALLVGAAVTLDLRLLGWRRAAPLDAVAPLLLPVARGGFAVAAVTGALLFTARAQDYAAHPVFLLKLGLLAAALANVAWLHGSGRWRRHLAHGEPDGVVRAAAAVSLLAWLSVLLAGRMVGYR